MYKNLKFFIYTILLMFIIIMITMFSTKKNIADDKKQDMINKQIEQQQQLRYANNNIERNTNYSNNDINNTNQESNNTSMYNENGNMTNNMQQDSEITTQKEETENEEDEKEVIQSKATEDSASSIQVDTTNTQNIYAIASPFNINEEKFAIVSKTANYQSKYSNLINKKYSIYRIKDDYMYEIAYIAEFAIPKDKSNEESSFFIINTDKYDIVEITIKALNNSTRRYSQRNLLNAPLNRQKAIKIKIQEQKDENTTENEDNNQINKSEEEEES